MLLGCSISLYPFLAGDARSVAEVIKAWGGLLSLTEREWVP